MPLSISVVSLEAQIKRAFKTARDTGSQDGADSDAIIAKLASDISKAIHQYTKSAVVNTGVNTAVAAVSPTGPVVGTGVGVGTGTLS